MLGDADVDDVEGNTSTCVRCEEKYRDLSDLYTELDHKYHMHVCMDIVDLVSTGSGDSRVAPSPGEKSAYSVEFLPDDQGREVGFQPWEVGGAMRLVFQCEQRLGASRVGFQAMRMAGI